MPEQEEQGLLQASGPEYLFVLMAGIHLAQIVCRVPTVRRKDAVQPLLIGGIAGIEILCAMVHIHQVAVGRRQVRRDVCHKGVGPLLALGAKAQTLKRQMSRQAGSAAKHLWIFAQGIERNQAAHARSHYECVLARRERMVSLVDKGFDFIDNELQVVVAQQFVNIDGTADARRKLVVGFGGKILFQAVGGVVDADNDAAANG